MAIEALTQSLRGGYFSLSIIPLGYFFHVPILDLDVSVCRYTATAWLFAVCLFMCSAWIWMEESALENDQGNTTSPVMLKAIPVGGCCQLAMCN